MSTKRLKVDHLDDEGCRALLARRSLGRLAFSFRDRVDIRPLNFVLHDDWLFGRTSEGDTLRTIRHHPWVAFQVDEVDDAWHWRSVVVRGPLHLLAQDRSEEGKRLTEVALRLVRDGVPETFAADDPAPERTILFGIAIQELSGRAGRLVDGDGT